MNKKNSWFLALMCFILGASTAMAAGGYESTLDFGRFGKLHLYRPVSRPHQVVLFVSGDGGWNKGVVDMARELAGMDALVVGVDITHYLKKLNQSKESCLYPAADFESLSKYIQKKFSYPSYIHPVLVGYSSGATLVYATLAQAPANTFKAALSLGFSPELSLYKPLCKGRGLAWTFNPLAKIYSFLPAKHLQNPWIALQGEIDQVCAPQTTLAFVKAVPEAEIVLLPKVGHGFSVSKNWLPQFKKAFSRLAANSIRTEDETEKMQRADLPVIEVAPKPPVKNQMAVVITGDGGWADIDRKIAAGLAEKGYAVAGLDSLKYFWTPRTPDGAAKDLGQMLDYYLNTWHKERVVLIGYSLGADVLPFMVSRLPRELRVRVDLIALLAPTRRTAFEFHLSDWLGKQNDDPYLIRPEVEKLDDLPLLCFYGKQEPDSLCRDRLPGNVTVIPMAGAHHFDGAYTSIVARILKAVPQSLTER